MDKIFIDTNIVIDFVQKREGETHVKYIMNYVNQNKRMRLYTSYLSFANLAFIIRKQGQAFVKQALKDTLKWCDVIHANDIQIIEAIKSKGPDFEDSLQIASAETKQCDVIITRNPDHFRGYTLIPVITPEDFVAHCRHS